MRTINLDRIKRLEGFIKAFRTDHDCFPTFAEMYEGLNYKSSQTLQADVRRLKERGFLDAESKTVTFSSPKGAIKGVPATIVGSIRCGEPAEAREEIEGHVILPAAIFGADKDLVLLKAVGDSMKDAQISDGDLLVVRKQPTAEVNNIVIACLCDGEATCKTLKKDDDGFYYLHPENNEYTDIVPCEGWYIYGVVRQVIHNV